MALYQYTRRIDKNIYKSINLSRAAFFFVCKFKIPSKVDKRLPLANITYTSQFRIPKFVVQISEFGIQNSEFRIRNCEEVCK